MKKFGLVGERLSHSVSPEIHNALGRYDYRLFEIAPEDFENFIAKADFDGLNITMPYKKAAFRLCQSLSPDSAGIGSVNTIIRLADGSLYGDNTDLPGFFYMLSRHGVSLENKRCAVFGTGGASACVAYAAKKSGALSCVTVSRTGAISYSDTKPYADSQIVINATPVGCVPDNDRLLLPARVFPYLETAVDLVYDPLRTAFVMSADASGITAFGGLEMLVGQAFYASKLFTGENPPISLIDEIYNRMKKKLMNIVIVGMPGAGKTTVGSAVAKKLNRTFIDTDEQIEKKLKKTCADIIRTEGEKAFRMYEKMIIKEASLVHGAVIATGGGCVEEKENITAIRQNGYVVWLERDIESLARNDRPLSEKSGALSSIYERRSSLYELACDIKIPAAHDAAEKIHNAFYNS